MALGPGVRSLRWACTFHALGDANLTRRQPVFSWNMGLSTFILVNVSEMVITHEISYSIGFCMDTSVKINIYP